MKVKESVGNYSQNEVYSEIDLFSDLPKLSERAKNKIRKSVGDLLVEETLISMSGSSSPVSGESFPALSKEYKEKKIAEGLGGSADLEFSGALKDSLKSKASEDGIMVGHFNKQAGKADGHNNFSGDSPLPKRRYLPAEGQSYKKDIQDRAESIIAEVVAQETKIRVSDIESVETKADLWLFLNERFRGLSRQAIKTAVLNNEDSLDALSRKDLLRFL